MSVLNPAPNTTGKDLYENEDFRLRDDTPDRKAGGSYDHNEEEWSATEANEWVGLFLFQIQNSKFGAIAIKCRNTTGVTLPIGPVRITGYNASNDVFTIGLADADGNSPAQFLLLSALANNTNGVAYRGGDFAYNTNGRTVGDPCYLSATGDITFTAPSGADQIVQELGRVKVANTVGTIAGSVRDVTKFGSSCLQTGATVPGLVQKTADYAVGTADNGKTYCDSSASGLITATLTGSAGQRNLFIAKSGHGHKLNPSSGHIKMGESTFNSFSIDTVGVVEVVFDGTDWNILAEPAGSFSTT